ncbi:PAS-domain containing protein, partial [Klebsiella pneumoniae]|uniref:PAS-domain containing protein n=1 Tax=Klebsiella pneumoniae TaxID=573 RepID=UPI001952F653
GEDRFVLANGRFREMFPELSARLVPGMPYREVLRIVWDLGMVDGHRSDFDTWRTRTLAWHGSGTPIENLYGDGRWIQFVDHRTSEGGTAGICT